MAANKLTATTCNAARLREDEKERLLGDGNGLHLYVRPSGKSWLFVFTFDGKRKKMALGAFPAVSLALAREKAADSRTLLANGIDPVALRDAPPASTKTVGDLLDTYLASLIGRSSHRQVSNVLKNHVSDVMRKLPLATVTKADLVTPIRKLRDDGKLRTAGLLHSYFVRSFALAHNAADNPDTPAAFLPFTMPNNPVANLKPVEGAAGETHEQIMSAEQLRAYATALQAETETTARDLLMLSLYCGGQRLTQVSRAVLEGNSVMVIMDTKGKNGSIKPRRHALPLLTPVANIKPPSLKDEQAVANLCDAATTVIEKISCGKYTQRVVRRTIENLLIDAGFSESDTGLLLSHGRSGLQQRHYLRGDRLELKTRMLEFLHGMLVERAPCNVVPLQGAA